MSKAEFITSVTLAGRREMDLAADVAKEKFVQKIIDFEKFPSVSFKCYIKHTLVMLRMNHEIFPIFELSE